MGWRGQKTNHPRSLPWSSSFPARPCRSFPASLCALMRWRPKSRRPCRRQRGWSHSVWPLFRAQVARRGHARLSRAAADVVHQGSGADHRRRASRAATRRTQRHLHPGGRDARVRGRPAGPVRRCSLALATGCDPARRADPASAHPRGACQQRNCQRHPRHDPARAWTATSPARNAPRAIIWACWRLAGTPPGRLGRRVVKRCGAAVGARLFRCCWNASFRSGKGVQDFAARTWRDAHASDTLLPSRPAGARPDLLQDRLIFEARKMLVETKTFRWQDRRKPGLHLGRLFHARLPASHRKIAHRFPQAP